MSLAYTIKQAREVQGISQGQLARNTKLHYSYISRVESGERTPEPPVLRKLSNALEVPFLKLMLARMSDELTPGERNAYRRDLTTWRESIL